MYQHVKDVKDVKDVTMLIFFFLLRTGCRGSRDCCRNGSKHKLSSAPSGPDVCWDEVEAETSGLRAGDLRGHV